MDRLRGLNVSIKKYLRNLISNDSLSPREILEQFLVEYQDKVVLKTFDNLRIKDNPSKYKNSIIDAIKHLLEGQNLSKMVEEYINKKKNGEKNEENQKEAEIFFSESLEYVLEQFRYIEDNLEFSLECESPGKDYGAITGKGLQDCGNLIGEYLKNVGLTQSTSEVQIDTDTLVIPILTKM
jgi:hypothetical protein